MSKKEIGEIPVIMTPHEAIYNFCGWLCCRNEKTTMGASYDCVPIADRIKEFCDINNIKEE